MTPQVTEDELKALEATAIGPTVVRLIETIRDLQQRERVRDRALRSAIRALYLPSRLPQEQLDDYVKIMIEKTQKDIDHEVLEQAQRELEAE